MTDTEDNVEIEVKEFKEEEVFKKPEKKKRVLTEKQKEALAAGRAKAKAKRDAIRRAEDEKKALKKVRKEQKDIAKAKELELKNKAEKKEKQQGQDVVREKIRKQEYEKKLKKYTAVKNEVLGKCATVKQYDALNTILANVSEEDIMDDSKMKNKLHSIIEYSRNYLEKKKQNKTAQ
tara:strand:+ start:341 stop:871 length:531 start_codon:yes stop_codon:yes gene_type:complete